MRCDALEASRVLHEGIDPTARKKERERDAILVVSNSFEPVARAWRSLMRPKWTERRAEDVIEILEKDVFPDFGARPIAELRASEVLETIRKIEKRAHRLLDHLFD